MDKENSLQKEMGEREEGIDKIATSEDSVSASQDPDTTNTQDKESPVDEYEKPTQNELGVTQVNAGKKDSYSVLSSTQKIKKPVDTTGGDENNSVLHPEVEKVKRELDFGVGKGARDSSDTNSDKQNRYLALLLTILGLALLIILSVLFIPSPESDEADDTPTVEIVEEANITDLDGDGIEDPLNPDEDILVQKRAAALMSPLQGNEYQLVGNLAWKIVAQRPLGSELRSTGSLSDLCTSENGQWLVIALEVENQTEDTVTVDNLFITTKAGELVSANQNTQLISSFCDLTTDETYGVEEIEGAENTTLSFLFDVSTDTGDLLLEVSDFSYPTEFEIRYLEL